MPIVVFGTLTVRRDRGAIASGRCANCGNVVVFRHVRETSWFNVFAVPLLPMARVHVQMCPVCSVESVMADGTVEVARSLAKQGRVWGVNDESTDEDGTSSLDATELHELRATWGPEIADAVLAEVTRCELVTSEPRGLVEVACELVRMGETVDVAVLRAAVSSP